MSLISEYRATEEAIKELQERLKNLSQDEKLKKELEFEGKLRELMKAYQKDESDIVALLDPDTRNRKPARNTSNNKAPTSGKRARRVKQYKNPHTGEVIETKGGNHKTLKEWKGKWGGDTVEGWATLLG
ncbi:DNA binding protein [Stutzerimonas urumqiensis]|uniref:histone-like nucleoid-structuring protein MvaT n=1 Tax=Stutzerimonas urumqiensis TaxID=638269 RepID=UPI003BAC9052